MYNPLDFDHWKEIWLIKEDDEILTVVGSFADAVAEEKRRRYQIWDDTGRETELTIVKAENDPEWARLKKIAQKKRAATEIIDWCRSHGTEHDPKLKELFAIYDQEI